MSRMGQTPALNAVKELQASNFLIYYEIVDEKTFHEQQVSKVFEWFLLIKTSKTFMKSRAAFVGTKVSALKT